MKKVISILFLLLVSSVGAQKFEYGLDAHGFLDNREYKSSYQIPQSMLGIRVAPELGFGWGGESRQNPSHHIRAGIDGLCEFSGNTDYDFDLRLYYKYQNKPFTFYLGMFPRADVLGNFPAVFFYDSLTYYRPNITGIYWKYERPKWNASVFLDWTSRQTKTKREAFIWGLSGLYREKIFFAETQMYMYHRAAYGVPVEGDHLHDMGALHIAAGLDFTEKTTLDTLYIRAGYIMGLERRRNDPGNWETPKNLLAECGVEWQGIGVKNIFFAGEGMMVFYQTPYNQGDLYWGDPFYQAKLYDRLDFYLKMMNFNRVEAKFAFALHFTDEGKMSTQQVFTLNIHLGNIRESKAKTDEYFIWQKWFRRK